MTRWLPFPLLFTSLLTMWLLLNQTFALGQILLGGVLSLGLTWGMIALQPERVKIRRPLTILRLALVVMLDIARSNIAVARIILSPGLRKHPSAFVNIPLELRHPYGLVLLACIISATPGTLWVGFDSATGILTIHVLDHVDDASWIDAIKSRYERRLREIFE